MTCRLESVATPFTLAICPVLHAASPRWGIVVRGGVGNSPENFTTVENRLRYDGIHTALQLGVQQLQAEKSALDTVEAGLTIHAMLPRLNQVTDAN